MDIVTKIDNLDEITDEYILYKHNFIKDKIEYALNLVKEYIIKNKLLIVGGTAIDYALKLKNDTLYNDLYQVPDFDIMSPNNVEHANNIGQILCNNKFENISIIPAIHHTTVRVQLLGFTVFDSTYIPQYLYDKIPYLEYNECKFVDPNFQKINQYLSLSFLFKITGPSYNILNRFKKDVERFDMLDSYYDLYNNNEYNNITYNEFLFDINNINIYEVEIIKLTNNNEYEKEVYKNLNNIHKEIVNPNVSYNIKSNFLLHGIMAYDIIYTEFNKVYTKLSNIIKFSNEDSKYINDIYKYIYIKNEVIYDTHIKFKIPEFLKLCFINNDNTIDFLIKKLQNIYNISNIKKLDNILDLVPKYVECKLNNINLEIYDLFGDLISSNLIYNKEINKYIPITSYNYNLVYFLSLYYLEDNLDKKSIYLQYYISLRSIIKIIQYIYYNYTDEYEKSNDFINSIFNYSINTYGIANYPDNYYHFIENFKNLVKKNQNLSNLPPKNYIGFPDCDINNIFDIKKSTYYNEKQTEVNYTNYANILD